MTLMPLGGFLDRLSPDIQKRIVASAALYRFRPGQLIFPADNPDWVGIVQEGVVRVFSQDTKGRTQTHRNVTAGGIIGLAVLVGAEDVVAAQAVGTTSVLRLETSLACDLRTHNAAFAIAVAREIHDRLLETSAAFVARVRGSLAQRLGLELLDLAAEIGEGFPLSLSITHEELANSLGSSRETISRQMKALAADGLLRQLGHGRVQLVDPQKLLAYSRGQF